MMESSLLKFHHATEQKSGLQKDQQSVCGGFFLGKVQSKSYLHINYLISIRHISCCFQILRHGYQLESGKKMEYLLWAVCWNTSRGSKHDSTIIIEMNVTRLVLKMPSAIDGHSRRRVQGVISQDSGSRMTVWLLPVWDGLCAVEIPLGL